MAASVIVRHTSGQLYYFSAHETYPEDYILVREATPLELELGETIMTWVGCVPRELMTRMRLVMNNGGVDPRPARPPYLRLVA